MTVSNPDRCLSTRVLNQCAVRKHNKLLMFRKTDFVKNQKPITTNTTYLPWYMYCMFALLECVYEPTLSHQTVSIKPLQRCGPYMPMAVLIRVKTKSEKKSR